MKCNDVNACALDTTRLLKPWLFFIFYFSSSGFALSLSLSLSLSLFLSFCSDCVPERDLHVLKLFCCCCAYRIFIAVRETVKVPQPSAHAHKVSKANSKVVY